MPSNHLILCCPLLPLPSVFPSIRVFSNESVFTSGGQSIGASASASVLPMNIQCWFPLGWTGWISLQSKGLSRVFSSTIVQKPIVFEQAGVPSLPVKYQAELSNILDAKFLSGHEWILFCGSYFSMMISYIYIYIYVYTWIHTYTYIIIYIYVVLNLIKLLRYSECQNWKQSYSESLGELFLMY